LARVILKNVNKYFAGNVVGAENINLEIKDKEFCVLVGPSGCGKSTTLRMIAGLEEISSGEIYIEDRLINEVPPKDRDIAMVFQSYALYPHMTVYDNMAFGLKLRGYSKKEIQTRVKEAAEILGISNLLDRKPKALSGGQRQRVAVGRAIVRKPKVFLFDEPLSNLDAKMRVIMRSELKKIHERLQATMIYVTHDQVEAMTMGDKIVVMKDGHIQQVADPIGLYDNPNTKFVAGFIGSPPMNFLETSIVKKKEDLYFQDPGFEIRVPENFKNKLKDYVDKKVIFGIRPEDIYDKLYAAGAQPENTATATVEVVEPMGSEKILHLKIGNHKVTIRANSSNKAQVNQDIDIVFNMQKMHVFDNTTQKAII
jgi:multiple sugar transport system ATP-binding protein